MRRLTLVYAYYDNPTMLARQYQVWASYGAWYQDKIRIVIVDDASPKWPAALVSRPSTMPPLRIYRALKDIPWHQDGARNLGAHVADEGWLFLSDMDHVLPFSSVQRIWRLQDSTRFYTLDRIDATTGQLMLGADGNHKPHPNTYVMHRELYWRAGGYDEDYCGVYGTDGAFRKRLHQAALHTHLSGAHVIRYHRSLVADASTSTLDRKAYGGPEAKRRAKERKALLGRTGKIVTLDFEWEQLL